MTNKLVSVWALVALFASAYSWAGLGNIRVESMQGERFRAIVYLDGALAPSNRSNWVGLADRATFDQLNVDYEPELSLLRFTLQPGANGAVIMIRSSAPIQSSYLSFVLELKTPSGRWVRDYTVMLDTPPLPMPAEGEAIPALPAVALGTAQKVPAPLVPSAAPKARHPYPARHARAEHSVIVPPQRVLPTANEAPPHNDASHPAQQSQPPLAASVPSAAILSDASAAQFTHMQQQIKQKDHTLARANQHIAELKRSIVVLQSAARSAVTKKVLRQKTQLWIGGLSLLGLLLVLAAVCCVWRRRRRPTPSGKRAAERRDPLSSTGVASPDVDTESAHDEVDPLVQAEVFLANGHDEQAENILKNALQLTPDRNDIRMKLLEIYANIHNKERFAQRAHEMYDAYDGRGALWERTRAMGLALDPENPLYNPEAKPSESSGASIDTPLDFADLETPLLFSEETRPNSAALLPDADKEMTDILSDNVENSADNLLNFDVEPQSNQPIDSAVSAPAEHSLLDFDFSVEAPAAASQEVRADQPAAESGDADEDVMDNAALALSTERAQDAPLAQDDLDATPMPTFEESAPAIDQTANADWLGDELATKLDLARVYLDMGDTDGAREVLQEVLRDASGALKDQAQEMLLRLTP